MLELTLEDALCLGRMRDAGCAVTVFLPHEIGEGSADDVEEAMCVAGWAAVNHANPQGVQVVG
jgi:hypothetical protein